MVYSKYGGTIYPHSAANSSEKHHTTYCGLEIFVLLQAYVKVAGYLERAFQIRLNKREREETLEGDIYKCCAKERIVTFTPEVFRVIHNESNSRLVMAAAEAVQ